MMIRITALMLVVVLLACSNGEKTETGEPQLDEAFLIENLDLDVPYFFEPVPLATAMAVEDSLGSRIEQQANAAGAGKAANDYVPGLRYQRPRIGLLRPDALYIHSKRDSVVRYFQYTFEVETQDSTQRALAQAYYFTPTSGLYPYLKKQLTANFGAPEPERVWQATQKPGVLELRASSWEKDDMKITLQVVESQRISLRITFRS